MGLRHQTADELHVVGHVHRREIRAEQEPAPVVHVGDPAPELADVLALFVKVPAQIRHALQQAGQVGAHVGIFLQHCRRVRQKGVAEVAHDELHVRPVGGHLVQRQGVAVFELGPGARGLAHVDGHRLAVFPGQLITGRVHRIGNILIVVARIELDAHAPGLLQVFLHQRHGLRRVGVFRETPAVQPDAVAHPGVVAVALHVQRPVAHHHAVDDVQLLPAAQQLRLAAVVAHLPEPLLHIGAVREQVKVRVYDLHGVSSHVKSVFFGGPSRRFFTTAIIVLTNGKNKARSPGFAVENRKIV